MAGPGWGWFCSMLGVASFMLPFFTFGVTKSWKETLKAFGLAALITKGLIFFTKAILLLVMTVPTPEASHAIMGSLILSCMGACFTACALLSFISYKSRHGKGRRVANWTWIVLLTFLVGVGIIMALIKKKQQATDAMVILGILFIIMVQIGQAVIPLINHCRSPQEFAGDEPAVAAIKTMAILITIVTNLYSFWSTYAVLKPHVTSVSLMMHQGNFRCRQKVLCKIRRFCSF